jgi:glycosyltransferase involved in cell wall biosynthesis
LLEYGLAGLAVVCTDVGDCRHVLDGGRCGMLVPAGDATAMAEALLRLLCEANLRKSMGIQLQAHVGTAYNQTALMTHFQHIYQQLTA